MLNKNSNRNHKEWLGCVPRLLLKCYHKTSKLVIKKKSILSYIIKQVSRQSSTTSNMDIVHNDMHIHRILQMGDRECTWVAS